MRYLKIILFIILIVSSFVPVFGETKLRVGVVEFIEKNNIGLENSGVIIPEILVSHLKNIGSYDLSERILLKKTLDEQKLQMTGLVSDETAVKLGKIYGLQAIITGTAVKIGNKITISGRVINTENADIIASGTVSFTDIENIEYNLEQLAYLLSNYSADDYKKIEVEKKLAKNRYGARLGLGYAANNTNGTRYSSYKEYMLGLFFHSRYFDADFIATPPPADVTGITGYASLNPFVHLGLAFGVSYLSDGINRRNNLGSSPDEFSFGAETISLLYGINYRATEKLRASVLFGYVLDGTYQYNTQNKYNTYKPKKEFKFPGSSYLISFEYYINDTFSVMFNILGGGGKGEPDFNAATTTQKEVNIETQVFYLSCGYSFSL